MKVGFIGGGKIAEAMVRGMIAAGAVKASDVVVSDISAERCALLSETYGAEVCPDNRTLVGVCSVIVLAVKPQGLDAVLAEIADAVTERHLVISIAAGKRLEGIAAVLTRARLVRVMPNLPATVGEAMSVFCAAGTVGDADVFLVERLLSSFGKVMQLPEAQFDAVTAVSGSGPAFFAYFLALVAEAGEGLGLAPDDAFRLCTQTMRGTARLLEQGTRPEELVKAVSSKGGTTEAGMKFLASPALSDLVRATLRAAADRSRELSA